MGSIQPTPHLKKKMPKVPHEVLHEGCTFLSQSHHRFSEVHTHELQM